MGNLTQVQYALLMSVVPAGCVQEAASAKVDQLAAVIDEVSLLLHSNPELNFEEVQAHDNLVKFLETNLGGAKVEPNYLLPTAFRATFGSGAPTIAICCEYDPI